MHSEDVPAALIETFVADGGVRLALLASCREELSSEAPEPALERLRTVAHALRGDAAYVRQAELELKAARIDDLLLRTTSGHDLGELCVMLDELSGSLRESLERLAEQQRTRGAGLRAIVLDDSATWRAAAQLVLERAGCVVEAFDHGDALDTVSGTYALVLWDASLLGGAEQLGRARARLAEHGAPKFIVYSAQSEESLRNLAFELGADGYLEKVGDGDQLFARLRRFLPSAPLESARAPEPKASFDVLVFDLDRWTCAVPSHDVEELVRAVAPERLPGAPAVVQGLINLRGRAVPLLDLRVRFNIEPSPLRASEHFIVLRLRQRSVAVRADRAHTVLNLQRTQIEHLNEVVRGVGFLADVASLDEGLLLIHDVEHFLSTDEMVDLERALEGATELSWS